MRDSNLNYRREIFCFELSNELDFDYPSFGMSQRDSKSIRIAELSLA
jgi:hypothetical protein